MVAAHGDDPTPHPWAVLGPYRGAPDLAPAFALPLIDPKLADPTLANPELPNLVPDEPVVAHELPDPNPMLPNLSLPPTSGSLLSRGYT